MSQPAPELLPVVTAYPCGPAVEPLQIHPAFADPMPVLQRLADAVARRLSTDTPTPADRLELRLAWEEAQRLLQTSRAPGAATPPA